MHPPRRPVFGHERALDALGRRVLRAPTRRPAAFVCPDLTAFCRLDELSLEVYGQRVETDRAVLAWRVVEPDQWFRRCGCHEAPGDTVARHGRTSRWAGGQPRWK
jgi:hypothetical protein